MAFVRTVRTGNKCTKQMGYNGYDNQGNYGFIALTPAYPCDRAPWNLGEENPKGTFEIHSNENPTFSLAEERGQVGAITLKQPKQNEAETLLISTNEENPAFQYSEKGLQPLYNKSQGQDGTSGCGCGGDTENCSCNKKKAVGLVVAVVAVSLFSFVVYKLLK